MTGTANANVGIPMILPNMFVWTIAFIPVIFLEGFVLQKKIITSYRNAFFSSAIGNALSTFVGFPLLWVFLVILELPMQGPFFDVSPDDSLAAKLAKAVVQSPWLWPHSEATLKWMIPTAMLTLLVPAFFVSWMIEYFVVRWWLMTANDPTRKAKPKNTLVRNACFQANVVSHIFMGLLIVVLGIVNAYWF